MNGCPRDRVWNTSSHGSAYSKCQSMSKGILKPDQKLVALFRIWQVARAMGAVISRPRIRMIRHLFTTRNVVLDQNGPG